MSSFVLSQIEGKISQLSREEQLWLIERVAHHLRESSAKKQTSLENQLAAMAADPEIQNELQKINEEFAPTEADGLQRI